MMSELAIFIACLEHNYKLNSSEYPLISSIDIDHFKNRITSFSKNEGEIGGETLYDPIMELLVQSSLAHFLYMNKNSVSFEKWIEKGPNIMPFHPNYMRFRFMDSLTSKKASVTLDSFKLYEFSPSTTNMAMDKFIIKVDELLQDPILKELVYSFYKKLQVEGDTLDRILGFVKTKTKPTRGIGLLYFIYMDLYLEHIDSFIHDSINKSGLNCFWSRCLNTAILGFTEKKTIPKFNKLLECVPPAWGLTAKVSTGSRGGRVLRPWRGKLYINKEGSLQWVRPESIIDL